MLRLEGSADWHAKVLRLLVGQGGQLHTQVVKVKAGDFLVQLQVEKKNKKNKVKGNVLVERCDRISILSSSIDRG